MINDAQVILAGYVATEPSFRLSARGTPTASWRLAFTHRRIDRETGEWSDGETSFVTVFCFRKLASNVAMSLRKGEPVLVKGRLQVRGYQDKEGVRRVAVEVDAHTIGHDLTRGAAVFSRMHRSPVQTAAESSAHLAGGSPTPDGANGAGPGGSAGTGGAASSGDPQGSGEPDGAGGLDGDTPGEPGAGSIVDEQAMAEFASEMSETAGELPVPS